ncbi:MAG: hypothetical protein EKK61_00100 [Rickettsiales bacterium]|nr:MAG: hypothetical protein EKK61_00100 [Rickettsiales bacterium]
MDEDKLDSLDLDLEDNLDEINDDLSSEEIESLENIDENVVDPEEELDELTDELDDYYSQQEAEKRALDLLDNQVNEYLADLKRQRKTNYKGKSYLQIRTNAVNLVKSKNFGYNLLLDRATYRESVPDNQTNKKIASGFLGLRKKLGRSTSHNFVKTFGFRSRKSGKNRIRDKSGAFYYGIVEFTASEASFNKSMQEVMKGNINWKEMGVSPANKSFEEFKEIIENNVSDVLYIPDLDTDKVGVACSCNDYYYTYSEANYSNACTPSFSNPPKFSGVGKSTNNPSKSPGCCKHILNFVESYLLSADEVLSSGKKVYSFDSTYRDDLTYLERVVLNMRKSRNITYSKEDKGRSAKDNINDLLRKYRTTRNITAKERLFRQIVSKYQRYSREGNSVNKMYLKKRVSSMLNDKDPLSSEISRLTKVIKPSSKKSKSVKPRKPSNGIEVISRAKKRKSI